MFHRLPRPGVLHRLIAGSQDKQGTKKGKEQARHARYPEWKGSGSEDPN
jgi:hypothetical protein